MRVDPGARLEAVWVDGKGVDPRVNAKLANVETGGSTADTLTILVNNRISEPAVGGTAVRAYGFGITGVACVNELIWANLITGYASVPGYTSAHATSRFGERQAVDGIAVQCEGASVAGNSIVDIGGSGIAVYGNWNRALGTSATQHSDINTNTIVSAGVSAYSALVADPVGECIAIEGSQVLPPPIPCIEVFETADFSGTTLQNNTWYSGSRTHFDIGMQIGTTPYWGDNGHLGEHISVTNNISTATTRVNVGIAVAGMLDVALSGNTSTYTLVDVIGDPEGTSDFDGCSEDNIAIDDSPTSSSLAAGSQAATVRPLFACLHDHAPEGGLEFIRVSADDQNGFAGATSGRKFVPYGNNCCDDPVVRMFEAWSDSTTVPNFIKDITEMKQMGANAIRLHVQFSEMIDGPAPGVPNTTNLGRLATIVGTAGKLGMYVDLTGLAPLQVGDPATWYENVATEDARWTAQGLFWKKVAATLKNEPAVLAYDLVNEPLQPVAPPPPWICPLEPSGWYVGLCPPTIGDPYWVQYLTKWGAGRSNQEIYQQWIKRMTDAIRRGGSSGAGDTNHLVTLGGGPGLSSDVDSQLLPANKLSYQSVHEYPNWTGFASLTTALVAGVPTSTLQIRWPIFYYSFATGDQLNLSSGNNSQIVTLSAPASNVSPTLSVNTFTPNYSYPGGSNLGCPADWPSACAQDVALSAVGDTARYKLSGRPLVVEETADFPAGKLVEEQYILSARDQVPARGWFGQWGHLTLSQNRQCLPPSSPYACAYNAEWGQLFQRLGPYIAPCSSWNSRQVEPGCDR